MLLRSIKILLLSLIIHVISGDEALAATIQRSDISTSFRLNKPGKQDLKLLAPFSIRCRIPQFSKTFHPRILHAAVSFKDPGTYLAPVSGASYKRAESAYTLGLIYPFHCFL
jgi:hypothetical protein